MPEYQRPPEKTADLATELSGLQTEKESASHAVDQLTEFFIQPDSKIEGGSIGERMDRKSAIIQRIIKTMDYFTPEQQMQTLNMVKGMPKRDPNMVDAPLSGNLRAELKNRLYGTPDVSSQKFIQQLSKTPGAKQTETFSWIGSPVELTIGNDRVNLLKDPNEGWVFQMPGGKAVPIGEMTKLGRGDFAANNGEVSREHVQLSQTAKGEVIVTDLSLNGTKISQERYPSVEEFNAQENSTKTEEKVVRKDEARSKLGRLFGRK